jgi:hypothetical protein
VVVHHRIGVVREHVPSVPAKRRGTACDGQERRRRVCA